MTVTVARDKVHPTRKEVRAAAYIILSDVARDLEVVVQQRADLLALQRGLHDIVSDNRPINEGGTAHGE